MTVFLVHVQRLSWGLWSGCAAWYWFAKVAQCCGLWSIVAGCTPHATLRGPASSHQLRQSHPDWCSFQPRPDRVIHFQLLPPSVTSSKTKWVFLCCTTDLESTYHVSSLARNATFLTLWLTRDVFFNDVGGHPSKFIIFLPLTDLLVCVWICHCSACLLIKTYFNYI